MPDFSDRRRYDTDCRIARALDSIGERWTLLILRELLPGPSRFTDLKSNIFGINATILSRRLEDLVAGGIVCPAICDDLAQGYDLTPRGQALWPVLAGLAAWDLGGGAPALAEPARGISPMAALVMAHLRWPAHLPRPATGFVLGAGRIVWRPATDLPFRRSVDPCDLEVTCTPECLAGLALGQRSSVTEEAAGALRLAGPLAPALRAAFP